MADAIVFTEQRYGYNLTKYLDIFGKKDVVR